MQRHTRIIAAASILLVPLSFGITDQLRMMSTPPTNVGPVDSDFDATARLVELQANPGPYTAAAWLEYVSVVFAIVALVAIWRLAVARAPRWAWAAVILATIGVFGQVVHLTGYFGLSLVMIGQEDLGAAGEIMAAVDFHPFMMAIFVPFLLGILAPIVQIGALRRARVVPRWSVVLVVAAIALLIATGSQVLTSAVYAVFLTAAFAPAALAFLRGPEVTEEPQPAVVREPMPA